MLFDVSSMKLCVRMVSQHFWDHHDTCQSRDSKIPTLAHEKPWFFTSDGRHPPNTTHEKSLKNQGPWQNDAKKHV